MRVRGRYDGNPIDWNLEAGTRSRFDDPSSLIAARFVQFPPPRFSRIRSIAVVLVHDECVCGVQCGVVEAREGDR